MMLHEYHSRSLEAALIRADESIQRMRLLLAEGGQDGVVRKIENNLSEQARAAVLAEVNSLRTLLAALAQAFSLQPHPLDLRSVLNAEIAALWVIFENCRPARMKGYGQEFSQDVSEALEKKIETVLAEILKLRAQLKQI
jgi:hypothetical protein